MITELNRGQTFFIIEHNMGVIMDLCTRVIVLDHGEKTQRATP
jgi:ABC-type branched-subunit amino acid transport system ATPase component